MGPKKTDENGNGRSGPPKTGNAYIDLLAWCAWRFGVATALVAVIAWAMFSVVILPLRDTGMRMMESNMNALDAIQKCETEQNAKHNAHFAASERHRDDCLEQHAEHQKTIIANQEILKKMLSRIPDKGNGNGG
jgi:hypothetical protein